MTDSRLGFEEQPVRIENSYVPGARSPSNSYGVEVQFRASGFPRPGAVLFEIGVVLGIHLAVALAVTLILRASGIV